MQNNHASQEQAPQPIDITAEENASGSDSGMLALSEGDSDKSYRRAPAASTATGISLRESPAATRDRGRRARGPSAAASTPSFGGSEFLTVSRLVGGSDRVSGRG